MALEWENLKGNAYGVPPPPLFVSPQGKHEVILTLIPVGGSTKGSHNYKVIKFTRYKLKNL